MISRNDSSSTDCLIAFCHIEKAAGTSLTHILRRVFFLQYAAVRPLNSHTGPYFTFQDLRIYKKFNPFIRAIGGHSVVPHTDLVQRLEQIKFITQVRDPVDRATSQYRFWVNRLKSSFDPDSFLSHHASRDFQVRKIAGSEDLELAKSKIRRHFMLAGSVKYFDEFLVLLAGKLGLPLRHFTYRRRNIGSGTAATQLPMDFAQKLRERNQLDQALLDWIDSELFAEYVAEYRGDFAADLNAFRSLQATVATPVFTPAIDSIYRNAYIKPATGLIRMARRLPYSGSYGRIDVG